MSGTQLIVRIASVLRELAKAGPKGIRLVDLASQCELTRPTTHRILQDLLKEGMVSQCPERRYRLGSALFEIGRAAPSPIGDLDRFTSSLQKLANESGDVVYLGVRQSAEILYLKRVSGDFPIHVHTGGVGDRLPIDGSYAGVSLLSGLEAEDLHRILHRGDREARSNNPTELARLIQQTKEEGFCSGTDFVFDGVAGMAAPVPNKFGRPYLAVSISTTSARLSAQRVSELKASLLRTAEAVGDLVAMP